jgi:aminoglycoside 2'-N-acetyltransferase I
VLRHRRAGLPRRARLGAPAGPHARVTPDGPRRTPEEDGAVFLLPPAGLAPDETGDLVCDWREGDVW